ncbi:MAG: toprim domain-containing protein, partial [Rikenellaceae bacterium]|nr:toprim domain-containing protein [Rikenellaceae bacterium]
VLGGVISPMQGIAPSDLKIDLLINNVREGEIEEIILALDTTVEGETTAFFNKKKLEEFPNIKISTIARGIGFGDQLDYADQMTITHALLNRRPLK